MRSVTLALLLAILSSWMAQPAWAESCTDGVDCACDCLNDTDGSGNNVDATGASSPSCNPAAATCYANTACKNKYATNPTPGTPIIPSADRLFCEDFDHAALHSTGSSGGYGNWPSDAGFEDACGYGDYWNQLYVATGSIGANDQCSWRSGDTCGDDTCGFSTCFAREWDSAGRWGANDSGNNTACIDIATTAEMDDEDAALGIPDSPGTDDNRGVWDGQFSYGARVAAGFGKAGGHHGGKSFATTTHFSLTQFTAYADNSATSRIWAQQLKDDEFARSNLPDGMYFFGESNPAACGERPYGGFIYTTSFAACASALSAATVSKGSACCSITGSSVLILGARGTGSNPDGLPRKLGTDTYTMATDFPDGDWGCQQIELNESGATSSFTISHNDVVITDITGFTTSALRDQGINQFQFDSYANENSTGTGTTAAFRRWRDNMVMKSGAPVSCQALGLGTEGSEEVPPPPANIQGWHFSLNEPTQDINNRPLKTLQTCEVERYANGVLINTMTRNASSATGGGVWSPDWAADLSPTIYCGMTLTGKATCTNSKGTSTVSVPPSVTMPPCAEGIPKAPTFSGLSVLAKLFRMPDYYTVR